MISIGSINHHSYSINKLIQSILDYKTIVSTTPQLQQTPLKTITTHLLQYRPLNTLSPLEYHLENIPPEPEPNILEDLFDY